MHWLPLLWSLIQQASNRVYIGFCIELKEFAAFSPATAEAVSGIAVIQLLHEAHWPREVCFLLPALCAKLWGVLRILTVSFLQSLYTSKEALSPVGSVSVIWQK